MEDMFLELEQQYSQHKDKNKILRCCERLRRFSAAFEPYFDILNVFIQVKPEWLAIFWGPIRLMLQVQQYFEAALHK